MNIALWIVQVLLAVMFGIGGLMKLAMPVEDMVANGLVWIETTGVVVARIAGASEFLAAIGLILPSVLRIQPKLTGYAALGLVLVMIAAAVTHAIRAEFAAIAINAVLGGLAAFVAWGRLKAHPIAPKAAAAA